MGTRNKWVELSDLPHLEAKRAAEGAAVVYLFANPVEYHGPHLSLHNDTLISRGLARDLHQRLYPGTPLVSAGEIEVGVGPTAGPGTRETPHAMVRELVREACAAAIALGARKLCLMTFHGAPLHAMALEGGIELARGRGVPAVNPFNQALHELIRLDGSRYADIFDDIENEEHRVEMMQGIGLDFHAGFMETSLTLHYAPHTVAPSYRALPACPKVVPRPDLLRVASFVQAAGASNMAREIEFAAWAAGWQTIENHPGYTGRPAYATASAGAAMAKHILDGYERIAREVLDRGGRSPEPPMKWVRIVTLDGRIEPNFTPTAARA